MDLAQIISQKNPSVNYVRNSGIGSDISLRGFERDNINVTIDGAKVCGACPNRMDPPAMHISSEQIKSIEIQEGPFDVANFGSLGGSINVNTQEPKENLSGSVELKAGSFDYKKGSAVVTGGNENIQLLIGASKESSAQYEDGDGKTIVEQVDSKAKMTLTKYQDKYKNVDAFSRDSFWSKLNIKTSKDSKLKLSYYMDSADDVLYPIYGMDAQVDKTKMFNAKYIIKNLSQYSDRVELKLYNSKVEHEMGTEFREYAADQNGDDIIDSSFRTHKVSSEVSGIRVENRKDSLVYGIDSSVRNWNGACIKEPNGEYIQARIPDVDTKNIALYSKYSYKLDSKATLSGGVRVNNTNIKANSSLIDSASPMAMINGIVNSYYDQHSQDRDFNSISANINYSYKLSKLDSFFVSFGQGVRVPDPKELYNIGFGKDLNIGDAYWKILGNPTLNETKNLELDIGYRGNVDKLQYKTKLFYSKLTDFIYAHSTTTNDTKVNKTLTFSNIDAKIYGFELMSAYEINSNFILDTSLAYQRGQKDEAISGQDDKDLAGVAPLKLKVALEYENDSYFGIVEAIRSSSQVIDSDNGEKPIDGYTVVNLKGGYEFNSSFETNFGLNNVFDKTYAVNNSYVGRGVIGTTGEAMVLNEMGRNLYANLKYKF
jgi:iron complex outermembrane receptor protein